MVAKKLYFMELYFVDMLIDLGMTKLFQLAEYVCSRCSLDKGEPAATQPQQVFTTIRFSNEDKIVEGELFN